MPNFDATGPGGAGSGTGRGQGHCGSGGLSNSQGFFGRGFGRGMRCAGRGFRFFANQNQSLDEEESFLKKRLEAIKKIKENSSEKGK